MTKMTYEELVQALLDRVKNDVDKREGSVIFDAIAPCAYFLTQKDFSWIISLTWFFRILPLESIWTEQLEGGALSANLQRQQYAR